MPNILERFGSLGVAGSPGLVDWTKHKVIVFESDDWGWCGWVPDLGAYESLCKDGSVRSRRHKEYWKSTLESPSDMDRLFSILQKHKGGDGRSAVFQPAYIMSTPDYHSIEASGYKNYSDLVIPDVPPRWERGDFIAKSREGIERGIWHPVYHGNTHVNIAKWWMNVAKFCDRSAMKAFDFQVHACLNTADNNEYSQDLTYDQQGASISEGTTRFFEAFGYYPESSIAPNYVWQQKTEMALAENGIKVIQAKNRQQIQRSFLQRIGGKIINFTGKKSSDKPWQIFIGDYNPDLELSYLTRNADFEPSGQGGYAEKSYQDIVSAWQRNEPAIVSTHRINYVYLDDDWVGTNLDQFDRLLSKISLDYPDAIYLTDYEVAQLYGTGKSIMRFGDDVICRNYTPKKTKFDVEVPSSNDAICVANLRTKAGIEFGLSDNRVSFVVDEGDYAIRHCQVRNEI